MNYDKQLTQVLENMPATFSGKLFRNTCIEHGLDINMVKKGITTSFLHLNAILMEGTRTWMKKDAVEIEIYLSDSTREEECIQYLKEKGYKIMKLNWEEL
jgi:hypothetical protein